MRPLRPAVGAGTIRCVDEAKSNTPSEPDARIDEEMEESRLLMMRREKAMTVEQRVELFECLSRDAAAIRGSAKRIG
jgi:hypothetical protein